MVINSNNPWMKYICNLKWLRRDNLNVIQLYAEYDKKDHFMSNLLSSSERSTSIYFSELI